MLNGESLGACLLACCTYIALNEYKIIGFVWLRLQSESSKCAFFLFRFLCANAAMDDDVCCSFKMTFKAILPSSVAVKSEKENDYRKTDDFNMHRELERNRERESERDGKAISSKRNIRIQQVKKMKKSHNPIPGRYEYSSIRQKNKIEKNKHTHKDTQG